MTRGCSSMVELQLPKLIAWVRFPSPAPPSLLPHAASLPSPRPYRGATPAGFPGPPPDSVSGARRLSCLVPRGTSADICPTLWLIDDQDLGRAREVLERFLAPPRSSLDAVPWDCAACGEQVEGDFDLCWNCGRAAADAPTGVRLTSGPTPTPSARALLAWFDQHGRKDLPWQQRPHALSGLGLRDHAPADPGRAS